jgi:hypothetical protein
MDILLESLKSIYAGMDEEQDALNRIEEILMRPEPMHEAEPEVPLEPPAEEPAPEPEIPVEQPPEVPEPEADTLPAIQSHVKTPPKKHEAPVQKAAPVAPPAPPEPVSVEPSSNAGQAPVDTDPAASVDKQDGVPDDAPVPSPDPAQNKIVSRLQQLAKAGKHYSAPLNSAALSSMDYDPRSKKLQVTFTKNNRTYEYKNVAIDKAAALISSNHKGTLFNRDIKQTSPAQEVG